MEFPPGFLLYRHLDVQFDRAGPAAAWVHGNSMIDRDILDGDLAIFSTVFYYSRWHALSMAITHPLAVAAGSWQRFARRIAPL